MIRGLPTTILCTLLAGAVGVGLFFVKHEVKEQEARLSELNREIERNQEAIHVLKAEWSYLNDPARLRALSERLLSMKVMGATQVATLESLPRSNRPTGPVYAEMDQPNQPMRVAVAQPAPAQPAAAAKTTPATAAIASAKPVQAPVKVAAANPAPAKPVAPQAAPAQASVKVAAAPVVAPVAEPAPVRTTYPAPAAQTPYRAPAIATQPQYRAGTLQPPAPVRPSAVASQPPAGRSIVIQSPALASTPALPGEAR